jgi:outer membrane protein OmpA-like peptidoglycan-associated protein
VNGHGYFTKILDNIRILCHFAHQLSDSAGYTITSRRTVMARFVRELLHQGLVLCLALLLIVSAIGTADADDCRRISNILVLFDASGFMKDKDRYQLLLKNMGYFQQAVPLTADGFFNVGLRHWGLKVGLGCDNTESVLAVQPWDPERFINAFPPTVSYGVSSLAAGLRAAADDLAGASGKSILVVVGGGEELCSADPAKITEQIVRNNPDLEIHTFQIGGSSDGSYWLRGIAQLGRGTYTNATGFDSPAAWYAWMKKYALIPCAPAAPSPAASPSSSIGPIIFDQNSFSVRSKDPQVDAGNQASLASVTQILRQNPTAQVVLHGFSDGKGKPDHNLKLSRQRAEAVGHYLASTQGIVATRISVAPHGTPSTSPLSSNAGRRVEFEIVR